MFPLGQTSSGALSLTSILQGPSFGTFSFQGLQAMHHLEESAQNERLKCKNNLQNKSDESSVSFVNDSFKKDICKGLLGRCSPQQQPRLLPFPGHEKILNHEKIKKVKQTLLVCLELAMKTTFLSYSLGISSLCVAGRGLI